MTSRARKSVESTPPNRLVVTCLLAVLVGALAPTALAQLDETWIVRIGDQAVRANADGSFLVPNVTAADLFGRGGPGSAPDFLSDYYYFVSAFSTTADGKRHAFSEAFQIRDGETYFVTRIVERDEPPRIPERLDMSIADPVIGVDETTQLRVIATFFDGGEKDATVREEFTVYRTSNPAIATVDQNGVVTGHAHGMAFLTAGNAGATAVHLLRVEAGTKTITVEGFLQLPDGTAAAGIEVMTTLGGSVLTDEEGFFSLTLEDVTITLDFRLVGSLDVGEDTLAVSSPTFTVEAETDLVDAGILNLVPKAPSAFFVDPIYHYKESFDDPSLFPGEVMLEDLDGDADLDAAVVFNSGNQVWVYLNDGDGTFAEDGRYPVGENPSSFEVGDLDGDGDLDVLVADGQAFAIDVVLFDGDDGSYNELDSVPMGLGNGLFSEIALTEVGEGAAYVEVDDLNGDGRPDVVLGAERSGLLVFLNDGMGALLEPVTYVFESRLEDEDLVVNQELNDITLADLDVDGDLDVVVSAEDRFERGEYVALLFNDGAGAFLERRGMDLDDGIFFVDSGDIDADGDPDLLVGRCAIHVVFNDGIAADDRASLPEVTNVDIGGSRGPRSFAAADFDGDPDFAFVGFADAGSVQVLSNDGAGEFTPFEPFDFSLDRNSTSKTSIVADDFDGDGDPDLAVSNNGDTGSVALWLNEDGTFVEGSRFERPTAMLVSGDLDGDGDGDLDILIAPHRGSGLILLANENAQLVEGPTLANEYFSQDLELGDVDRDGFVDIIDASSFLVVIPGLGGGDFAPAKSFGNEANAATVALGDLNGDGALDVATSNDFYEFRATIFLNDGAGGFSGHSSYSAGNTNACAVVPIDVDGDGDLDVATGSDLRIFLNRR